MYQVDKKGNPIGPGKRGGYYLDEPLPPHNGSTPEGKPGVYGGYGGGGNAGKRNKGGNEFYDLDTSTPMPRGGYQARDNNLPGLPPGEVTPMGKSSGGGDVRIQPFPYTGSNGSRMAGDAGKYLKYAMQRINQDDDIATTISGNNNTVNNNQDNSITQKVYGGSNRTFNYYGGGGESRLYDTPVSAATMGGFYDVDDSPSAQAKFHDLHTGLNTDYQRAQDKYYKQTGTFDYDSDKSRAFDPRKMMQRIDESPQRSYDMADKELANLYGDIWNFKMPNYEFGEPPEPIKSPFDKGGDDDKDKDD